uniref:Uncharacterized protein n=1 Tax=Arundo donax TaxID=35708 RepID=A0A0A9HP49_ARUDO
MKNNTFLSSRSTSGTVSLHNFSNFSITFYVSDASAVVCKEKLHRSQSICC